ncbi:MAG: BACON domain-containing protein [Bacteroidales bacterium]|nr:BACON domain-containing protein [Bacteroidales bacterium]
MKKLLLLAAVAAMALCSCDRSSDNLTNEPDADTPEETIDLEGAQNAQNAQNADNPESPEGAQNAQDADDSDSSEDGNWPSIQLSQDAVEFPSQGGTATVTALNYKGWFICEGYENGEYVNGKWYHTNYVVSESNNNLDGGWYHATVPDECHNQLVVTADENTTGKAREAYIEMSAGDVFAKVKISQL